MGTILLSCGAHTWGPPRSTSATRADRTSALIRHHLQQSHRAFMPKMSNKYNAPEGPPPSYPAQPAQVHYDAGPAYPQGQSQAYYQGQSQDYYSQQPQGYYGGQQGYYPQQGYPQQGYYPQQGMYYGQQPQGYYGDRSRGTTGGAVATGLCAGLCASLCCLDLCLFFQRMWLSLWCGSSVSFS